jgi:hypothetical protein
MSILSYFKEKYKELFFSSLLCLESNSLSKILELAEDTDPGLKDAIVGYIHSLKGR